MATSLKPLAAKAIVVFLALMLVSCVEPEKNRHSASPEDWADVQADIQAELTSERSVMPALYRETLIAEIRANPRELDRVVVEADGTVHRYETLGYRIRPMGLYFLAGGINLALFLYLFAGLFEEKGRRERSAIRFKIWLAADIGGALAGFMIYLVSAMFDGPAEMPWHFALFAGLLVASLVLVYFAFRESIDRAATQPLQRLTGALGNSISGWAQAGAGAVQSGIERVREAREDGLDDTKTLLGKISSVEYAASLLQYAKPEDEVFLKKELVKSVNDLGGYEPQIAQNPIARRNLANVIEALDRIGYNTSTWEYRKLLIFKG